LTRFYIKLILPIAFACLIFTLTARAIGTTQPTNPALRGFIEGCENKPQPCWYGIVPGVTSDQDAAELMLKAGYTRTINYNNSCFNNGGPACYRSDNLVPGFVQMIWSRCTELGACRNDIEIYGISGSFENYDVMLGDVIIATGLPPYIRHDCNLILSYDQLSTRFTLMYRPDRSFIFVDECRSSRRVSPMYPIRRLELRQYLDVLVAQKDLGWHGFVPGWRYCQLEPEITYCA
jgi:hypothetical protein